MKTKKGLKFGITFYNGLQFTDNRLADLEPNSWEDAKIIFEGEFDDDLFTRKEVDRKSLYYQLS